MSWLRKLLKRDKTPATPGRDLLSMVKPFIVPALRMRVARTATRSHIGGDPNLPAGTPWPERHGKRLSLLGRVSLSEVQQALHIPWLPADGALLFFYDVDEQPWGFNPKDRGGSAVLHVPDLPGPVKVVEAARPDESVLGARNVMFQRIDSLPSLERAQEHGLLTDLSDAETDAYYQLPPRLDGPGPEHQIAGWPSPIQGDDMEVEAQMASSSVDWGDEASAASPEAARLEPGAKEWRLLLQLDSDEHMDVMWGDAGMIYFWVREQEAAAGRFDNTWVILQCH